MHVAGREEPLTARVVTRRFYYEDSRSHAH